MERVHIGTMGWSYNFWVGNFYPTGLTSKEFLTEYSKHFDTVEVDSTFYRIPRQDTVLEWKDKTPSEFLFAIKFPRIITHIKKLKNCEPVVKVFLERISYLQSKLGPLLLQFPPAFKQEHLPLLSDFLAILPAEYRFVVEVRNPELLRSSLFSLLRKNGVALALVGNSHIPIVEETTADFVYIRLEGDRAKVKGTLGRVEVDRTIDVKRWAEKIEMLRDTSKEVFVYVSKIFSGHPPTDAEQLSRLL